MAVSLGTVYSSETSSHEYQQPCTYATYVYTSTLTEFELIHKIAYT